MKLFTSETTLLGFELTTILKALWLLAASFILVYIVHELIGAPSIHIDRLFNLDRESNLPTWYSSFLWCITAGVSYQCYRNSPLKNEQQIMLIFSVLFLGLSIDEVAMIHEHVIGLFGAKLIKQFTSVDLKGNAWPIIIIPFLLFGAGFLYGKVQSSLNRSKPAKYLIFLGLFLLLCGGWFFETVMYFLGRDWASWTEVSEIAFEEFFEMAGAISIFTGLFAYLHQINENSQANVSTFYVAETFPKKTRRFKRV